jgi:hypothetical protein
MDESHYLGVYWLARGESAGRCAHRAARLFQSLAECDRDLSQWYGKGRTLDEALEQKLDLQAPGLERTFQRQDTQEGRMQGEGFSLRLWNGEHAEGGTALSLHCGEATPWVSNACVLTPPREGPTAERLLTATTLARILRALVLAWNPEWGLATSHAHRERMTDSAEAGTFVGWLTYFSHRRGVLPPLPLPVQLEPVEDLGTLVLLTPERFSSANPHHLDLAREVSERLERAGVLSPLRPESP